MFEISEVMRAFLVTRVGVDSFNDALAEADVPYRLFRVPDGYQPSSGLDHHVVSSEQVRLPAQDGPHGDLDIEEVDSSAVVEEIKLCSATKQRIANLTNTVVCDDRSLLGYDPFKGVLVRVVDFYREEDVAEKLRLSRLSPSEELDERLCLYGSR